MGKILRHDCLKLGQARLAIFADFKGAETILKKACSLKSAEACYYVGIYSAASDDKSKQVLFESFLQKACDYGAQVACDAIKSLKQETLIINQYESECDKGNVNSCLRGAENAAKNDIPKSINLYEKACALDNDTGCYYSAVGYYASVGIKKNPDKSIKYVTKSCGLGNYKSCAALGTFYIKGDMVKKDEQKGLELYIKACEMGYQDICEYLKKQEK